MRLKKLKGRLGFWSSPTNVSLNYVSKTCNVCGLNKQFFLTYSKSTKVHLYYCMKNCDQSPTKLKENTMNIVSHYQVSIDHNISCSVYVLDMYTLYIVAEPALKESSCRHSRHSGTKIQLTSLAAIEAHTKTLQSTLIYKDSESYG